MRSSCPPPFQSRSHSALQPHFSPACFRMLFRVPSATSSLGFPGTTRLGRVLELAVASAGCDEIPAIFRKQAKHLGNLHCERIAGVASRSKSAVELAV